MQIQLLPLFSRLVDKTAISGISLHQQATWDAIANPEVDVVINTALTGDGKSYAAFGAYPNGEVLSMYPTNELVRDQQRQLASYYKKPGFRIHHLTGYDLEAWSRAAKQSKAETLLNLSEADVLLTNPDLFYYLHQGNYLKEFIKAGRGEKIDLWQQIDAKFKALIFDEFHTYQPSQVSGVINTLLLMRSVGIKHQVKAERAFHAQKVQCYSKNRAIGLHYGYKLVQLQILHKSTGYNGQFFRRTNLEKHH